MASEPNPPNAAALPEIKGVYDRKFWFAYVANTALMVGVSALFRYADFVALLGGSEGNLGLIVGVGAVGGLAMRFFQAEGIDRYGPRLVWLLSLVGYIAAVSGHLLIEQVDGPAIYALRILLMTSLAGAFGASITYVSLTVPEPRIAEMIGSLGSSGFLGMALGPAICEYLFSGPELTRGNVNSMFFLAAAAGGVSLVAAALATQGHVPRKIRKRPPLFSLLRRYHPGWLLLIGIAMGVGLGVPGTFIRAYAAELHISGVRTFFLVYAAVAFSVRIAARRMVEKQGVRRTVLIGMTAVSLGTLLYLVVSSEATFVIPAVVMGIGHAMLFPAVVSGAAISFPQRYRGLATTAILAMFDLGNLLGQPAVGGLIEITKRFGLPSYPITFALLSGGLCCTAMVYAVMGNRGKKSNASFQSGRRIEAASPVAPTNGKQVAQNKPVRESVGEPR